MIETCVLQDEIIIQPSQMGRVKETISQSVQARVATCSLEHGYIQSVGTIRVRNNMISRVTGNCIVSVSYNAICVKPVEGEVLTCTVVLVLPEGILVVHDKIRIIVPAVQRRVGELVQVRILCVRYEQHEYQCVGQLNLE